MFCSGLISRAVKPFALRCLNAVNCGSSAVSHLVTVAFMALLSNNLIMKPEPYSLESKTPNGHCKIDRPPILSTLMRTSAAMAAAAVATAANVKQQTAASHKTDQNQTTTVFPTTMRLKSSPPTKQLPKRIKRKGLKLLGSKRFSRSHRPGYTFARSYQTRMRRLLARHLKTRAFNPSSYTTTCDRVIRSSVRSLNVPYRPVCECKSGIDKSVIDSRQSVVNNFTTTPTDNNNKSTVILDGTQSVVKCIRIAPKLGITNSTNVASTHSTSVSSSGSDSPINLLPFPADEPCEVIHHRASANQTGSVHTRLTLESIETTHSVPPSAATANLHCSLPQTSTPLSSGFSSSQFQLLSVLPTTPGLSISAGLQSSQSPGLTKTIASLVTNPATASELWSKIQLLLESAKRQASPNRAQMPAVCVSISSPTSSFWTNPPNEVVMSTGQQNLTQSVRPNSSRGEEIRRSLFVTGHPQPVITSVKSLNPCFSPRPTVSLPTSLKSPSLPVASGSSWKSTSDIPTASASGLSNMSEHTPVSVTIRPGQIHRLLLRETDGLTVRDACVGDLAIVYLGQGCWRPLLLPPEVDLVTKSKSARAQIEEHSGRSRLQQETAQRHPQLQRRPNDNPLPKPPQTTQPPFIRSHPNHTPSVNDNLQPNETQAPSVPSSVSGQASQGFVGKAASPFSLLDWVRQHLTSSSQVAVHPVLVGLLPSTMPTAIPTVTVPTTEPIRDFTRATAATVVAPSATVLDQPSVQCVTSQHQTYTVIPIHISTDVLNRQSSCS
ncbi:hypothetical protein D915_009157 [Fasciola hepatica]|uniref:Uncharacterized protein n=1 Tax=Fasciola hepatica TaxID=6192 RepID=A0A4E0R7Y7_FASHE|nr:hypothetical protein D915_009157 [Fasciola hepatica]